jgi:nucleotide-binding universal stress UspA family protein
MNTVYKKILVPIDGSKNSLTALSHAVTLARFFDAEICILYISVLSQKLPVTAQVQGNKIPQYASETPESFAKKIITEALKYVPENIRVRTHNELGEPRTSIIDYAERNDYDIIVIGSRGLGTISRLIMGSVSTYVVHHSQCPILVVK